MLVFHLRVSGKSQTSGVCLRQCVHCGSVVAVTAVMEQMVWDTSEDERLWEGAKALINEIIKPCFLLGSFFSAHKNVEVNLKSNNKNETNCWDPKFFNFLLSFSLFCPNLCLASLCLIRDTLKGQVPEPFKSLCPLSFHMASLCWSYGCLYLEWTFLLLSLCDSVQMAYLPGDLCRPLPQLSLSVVPLLVILASCPYSNHIYCFGLIWYVLCSLLKLNYLTFFIHIYISVVRFNVWSIMSS